jgi:hypothetical protein
MTRRVHVLWLLLGSLPLMAQPKPCPVTLAFDQVKNMMVTTRCQSIVSQTSLPSPTPGPDKTNTSSDVRKSNETFAIWSNEYTMRTFNDQTIFTRVIFIVVNVLVLAGLGFSWVQFRVTLRLSEVVKSSSSLQVVQNTGTNPGAPSAAPPALAGPPPPAQSNSAPSEQGNPAPPEQTKQVETSAFPTSEFKFGPDGFAMSSAFIGLIILGFALGFYLMYLKYVYPIETMGSQTPRVVQSEPAASPPHGTE